MGSNRGWFWLLGAVVCAVGLVAAPIASSDPGSPSYLQGKQAIDIQVNQHHVVFPATTDWQAYCQEELGNVTKSGVMPRVDSPADFIAGCQDEGRALASH
ncbi:hypothetical protein A5695_17790 [Mycobacterium sp. E1747]|nr:hypothetical protein A5695_17790 [Mycobacterium sp. E1747]